MSPTLHGRRGWLVAIGLSIVVHAATISVMGLGYSALPSLPRIEIHEVAGVAIHPPVPTSQPAPVAAPDRPQQPRPAAAEPAPSLSEERRSLRSSSILTPVPGGRLASRSRPVEEQPPRPSDGARPPVSRSEEPQAPAIEDQPAEAEPAPVPQLELPEALAQGDLSPVMTGKARVAILVRTGQLASSPHVRDLRRTIRAVPGFLSYFGDSGFDPMTDLQWMTVRTPNPRSLVRTAITAELAVSADRARATIERAAPPSTTVVWEDVAKGRQLARMLPTDPGGPRGPWKRLGWALVDDQPTSAPPLLAVGPLGWARRAAREPAAFRDQARAELLNQIQLDGREPDLVISAQDLLGRIVSSQGGSEPVPSGIVVAVFFEQETIAIARLWLESEAEALVLVSFLRAELDRLAEHPLFRLLHLETLPASAGIRHQGNRVDVELRLEEDEVAQLLSLVALLLGGSSGQALPGPSRARPQDTVEGPLDLDNQ